MKHFEIIRKRKGRIFEVVEFDTQTTAPARIYTVIASFGELNDALDYLLKRRLEYQPIDYAIDFEPKETR